MSLIPSLDELTANQGDGYTIARHLLGEIDDAGPAGISAADLGRMIGDLTGGQLVGAWLRHLRAVHGWVEKTPVSPGSTRTVWHLTDAGRAYLAAGAKAGRPDGPERPAREPRLGDVPVADINAALAWRAQDPGDHYDADRPPGTSGSWGEA